MEENVIEFLDYYIEKEEEKRNHLFFAKLKLWTTREVQADRKKTIFGQIKTIYKQKKLKYVGKEFQNSVFLFLVQLALGRIVVKYL